MSDIGRHSQVTLTGGCRLTSGSHVSETAHQQLMALCRRQAYVPFSAPQSVTPPDRLTSTEAYERLGQGETILVVFSHAGTIFSKSCGPNQRARSSTLSVNGVSLTIGHLSRS